MAIFCQLQPEYNVALTKIKRVTGTYCANYH